MKPALGIEIGGTKIQAGLGLRDGALTDFRRRTVVRDRGAEGVRTLLAALVEDLLAGGGGGEAGPGTRGLRASDLAGIGVGFGGPVEYGTGRVVVSHQIDGWRDFPLRRWLEDRYGTTVTVLNDADAAAWAEARLGAGRNSQRVLYVTVGSGVGAGWVQDGRLDFGQGLGAAEIGHTWVCDPDSGRPTQLEDIASGWAIAARAAASYGATGSVTDAAAVYTAAEAGNPAALSALERAGDALAQGLANALALWHPQTIILGGGVSLMGRLFWEPLTRSFARYAFPPFREGCRLVRAALGEEVVVIGAILAALDAGGGTER